MALEKRKNKFNGDFTGWTGGDSWKRSANYVQLVIKYIGENRLGKVNSNRWKPMDPWITSTLTCGVHSFAVMVVRGY